MRCCCIMEWMTLRNENSKINLNLHLSLTQQIKSRQIHIYSRNMFCSKCHFFCTFEPSCFFKRKNTSLDPTNRCGMRLVIGQELVVCVVCCIFVWRFHQLAPSQVANPSDWVIAGKPRIVWFWHGEIVLKHLKHLAHSFTWWLKSRETIDVMRNVPSDSQASLAAKAEEVTDYFVPDHFSTEIAGRME